MAWMLFSVLGFIVGCLVTTWGGGKRKPACRAFFREKPETAGPSRVEADSLQESETRFRKIFETSPDAIAISRMDGTLVEVNEGFVLATGYDRETAIGRRTLDIGFWLDAEDRELLLNKLQENQIVNNHEMQFRNRNGSVRTGLISASMINLKQENRILFMLRDITERKEAEAEKTELEKRLRQAQKMESIGTLAGGIAHDFNNILFPIIGYTEMMMADVPEESPAMESLEAIYQSAQRARELVWQILTFSRQDDQDRQPIQVEPIIKETIKLMRSTIPTTIEIRSEIFQSDQRIVANPTQIHQIVLNLCTNAYHAMQADGGLLEVYLIEEELTSDQQMNDALLYPGSYLKLSVRDTGKGIPAEVLHRIFEPYFTTKPPGKGTGLGLSVVHGIVKVLGGEIIVESEPGSGTTFTVYLPSDPAESVEDTLLDHQETPTGHGRILLVDDEKPIVLMAAKMLTRLGYQVTQETDPDAALARFRENPCDFDLLITDMTMPKMTGAQLAGEIFAIRPALPAILCTGFSDRISEKGAKAIGIGEYLMKPISRRKLAEAVHRSLRTGDATADNPIN